MRCKIDPLLHAYFFFFALFCICISVLGRNDMKMKRELFCFSFAHSFFIKAAMIFAFYIFSRQNVLGENILTNEKPGIFMTTKILDAHWLVLNAQRWYLSDKKFKIFSTPDILFLRAKKKSPKLITGCFCSGSSGMNEWGFDGGYF